VFTTDQRRLDLQTLLTDTVGTGVKVYFQPPDGTKMAYPCVVYHRDQADSVFADNIPYRFTQRYQVTVIDQDPDSSIRGQIASLPMCLFNRHFAAGNLNHDVYVLYF
jgi:hypothetical protein